jgi:hypothetical protein
VAGNSWDFLSAVVAGSSGDRRPKSTREALKNLQSGAIL